jgi:hypothetical protein
LTEYSILNLLVFHILVTMIVITKVWFEIINLLDDLLLIILSLIDLLILLIRIIWLGPILSVFIHPNIIKDGFNFLIIDKFFLWIIWLLWLKKGFIFLYCLFISEFFTHVSKYRHGIEIWCMLSFLFCLDFFDWCVLVIIYWLYFIFELLENSLSRYFLILILLLKLQVFTFHIGQNFARSVPMEIRVNIKVIDI